MLCQLCGKNESVWRAMVEGSELVVCDMCGKFGKIVGKLRYSITLVKKAVKTGAELPEECIVADYSAKIKGAREKMGKTQEEFAKLITEKESIVHKLETGKFEPPIDLAKKIEHVLKIKLVEKEDTVSVELPKEGKKGGFTLGDFIKVKTGKNV